MCHVFIKLNEVEYCKLNALQKYKNITNTYKNIYNNESHYFKFCEIIKFNLI